MRGGDPGRLGTPTPTSLHPHRRDPRASPTAAPRGSLGAWITKAPLSAFELAGKARASQRPRVRRPPEAKTPQSAAAVGAVATPRVPPARTSGLGGVPGPAHDLMTMPLPGQRANHRLGFLVAAATARCPRPGPAPFPAGLAQARRARAPLCHPGLQSGRSCFRAARRRSGQESAPWR